jgi:outer membrane protein TolC
MKKYIACIVLTTLISPSFSQNRDWTLNQCIEYGLTHNNGIKKQLAQIEISKQNFREAVGSLFPSLNAGTDGTSYYGRVLDKDTYQYVNTNTIYDEYQLSSSVTLFDGFAKIAKARMERINKLKGLNQLQLQKDLLAYEIMELFFNVRYYQGTSKLADEQLNESETNLKKARQMEQLGLKANPDIAEMEAQAAQNHYLLVKQQNLLNQEIIKLKNKINLPVEENLTIVSTDSSTLVSTSAESAIDIFRQALGYSPLIKVAEKSVKASELAVDAARGHLFPTLSLYGGYNTYFSRLMNGAPYTPFRDQLNNNQNYNVGLSLTVPVFNGFSRQSELQRSKQQLAIARYEYDDTKRSLYSDIEQAVADVNGIAQEYIHATKQRESMLTAHDANMRKYELGLVTALEVTTSANRLLQARIEELNAGLRYQLKARLLNYYKGNSFITTL